MQGLRSSQNLPLPTGIRSPGRGNTVCGTGRFQRKKTPVNLNSYRPSRRQENGGPEPIDLCYAESENSRVTTIVNCRDAIEVERQYLCLRMRFPERGTTYCTYLTVKRQRMVRGVGPTLLRERNIVTDSSKMVRVGRCGAHY